MTRYPLAWPSGWRRITQRKPATFGKRVQKYNNDGQPTWKSLENVTIAEGTKRVLSALDMLGVKEGIISTNLKLRIDGLPRSDQGQPADPGVAVYWKKNGNQKVMAIDRYTRVADNLAAIAATLEAMRAIDRHGGAAILDRAFTGFEALPEPNNWRHVLGLTTETATLEKAEAAYKKLAMTRHPDRGGTDEQMAAINAARKQAHRELTP